MQLAVSDGLFSVLLGDTTLAETGSSDDYGLYDVDGATMVRGGSFTAPCAGSVSGRDRSGPGE